MFFIVYMYVYVAECLGLCVVDLWRMHVVV